jgi:uncharacterized protein (DUF433 family)
MDKLAKVARKPKDHAKGRSVSLTVHVAKSKIALKKNVPRTSLKSFSRITRTPGVMGGKPCIKGSRMTVGMIVAQIGDGATIEELIDDFPVLKREDILEAIRYAGWYSGDMLLDLDPAA